LLTNFQRSCHKAQLFPKLSFNSHLFNISKDNTLEFKKKEQ